MVFFFFSSRRRHTRCGRDWSSDVCSSDLEVLRPGDIALDTVGPFQTRSTRLVEGAIEIGCDVVDLSDSLAYARAVLALHDRAASAGVRLFTSCSAIATVAASA